jgi:glycine cleavage system H lipoate-binding protein/TusA-related sulfurtransferase
VIIGKCYFDDSVLNDVENNVWVRMNGDVGIVGINSILAWMGGAFRTVSLPSPGTLVGRGKNLGSLESARHFDVVRSPLSGTVVEANERLLENPRLLNKDPYGEGWFVKIMASNYPEEARFLSDTLSVRDQMLEKITQLRIHCLREFPDYEMYEIGTECSAVLARLDEVVATSSMGDVIHLVTDDPTATIEMVRWSDRTGNSVAEDEPEGRLAHFLVKKTKE